MARLSLLFLLTFAGHAQAHVGHIAEVAGHGHLIGAAAAVGAAIAAAVWAGLKAKDEAEDDDEPDGEEAEA